MPKVLWPIFHNNRHLLNDLPAIGANAIEYWARARYGVRPYSYDRSTNIWRVPKLLSTFAYFGLEGGLEEFRARWVNDLKFARRDTDMS